MSYLPIGGKPDRKTETAAMFRAHKSGLELYVDEETGMIIRRKNGVYSWFFDAQLQAWADPLTPPQ